MIAFFRRIIFAVFVVSKIIEKEIDKTLCYEIEEFIEELNPRSNINISTAIIYYLQNVYEHDNIDIDVIFTCWRELGTKLPVNLTSNLKDICSSKYGYANVDTIMMKQLDVMQQKYMQQCIAAAPTSPAKIFRLFAEKLREERNLTIKDYLRENTLKNFFTEDKNKLHN